MEVEGVYRPFRPGDVRHSLADISRARELLGYRPTHSLASGLGESLSWYVDRFAGEPALQRSGGRLKKLSADFTDAPPSVVQTQ